MIVIIRRAGSLATIFGLLSLQFAPVPQVPMAETPTVDYSADNTCVGMIYYRIVLDKVI